MIAWRRTQLETLTLTAWGRERSVLEQLVADAAAAYERTVSQRTVVGCQLAVAMVMARAGSGLLIHCQ